MYPINSVLLGSTTTDVYFYPTTLKPETVSFRDKYLCDELPSLASESRIDRPKLKVDRGEWWWFKDGHTRSDSTVVVRRETKEVVTSIIRWVGIPKHTKFTLLHRSPKYCTREVHS